MSNVQTLNQQKKVRRNQIMGLIPGDDFETDTERYDKTEIVNIPAKGSRNDFHTPRLKHMTDVGYQTLDLTKKIITDAGAGGVKLFFESTKDLFTDYIAVDSKAGQEDPKTAEQKAKIEKAKYEYRESRRTSEEIAAKVDKVRTQRDQAKIAYAAEGVFTQEEARQAGFGEIKLEDMQNVSVAAAIRRKRQEKMHEAVKRKQEIVPKKRSDDLKTAFEGAGTTSNYSSVNSGG